MFYLRITGNIQQLVYTRVPIIGRVLARPLLFTTTFIFTSVFSSFNDDLLPHNFVITLASRFSLSCSPLLRLALLCL